MDLVRIAGPERLRLTTLAGLRLASALRFLLLSAAVFIVGALTGALLAGTAPAGGLQRTAGTGSTSAIAALPATSSASTSTGPRHRSLVRQRHFALSMVYSGATALTLSAVGAVIVGRRRRYW